MFKQKDVVFVQGCDGGINIHKDADRYNTVDGSTELILRNAEGMERARYSAYQAVRLVSIKDKDFFPNGLKVPSKPKPEVVFPEDTGEAQPA